MCKYEAYKHIVLTSEVKVCITFQELAISYNIEFNKLMKLILT